MKVMSIRIKSYEDVMRDFKEGFEAARKRLPFKPRIGTYFASLEAVRNFLTPKRLELLYAIKRENPSSVYALAKIVGRSFPGVHRDVRLLVRHGVVSLAKAKDSPRRAVRPTLDYDALEIRIPFSAFPGARTKGNSHQHAKVHREPIKARTTTAA